MSRSSACVTVMFAALLPVSVSMADGGPWRLVLTSQEFGERVASPADRSAHLACRPSGTSLWVFGDTMPPRCLRYDLERWQIAGVLQLDSPTADSTQEWCPEAFAVSPQGSLYVVYASAREWRSYLNGNPRARPRHRLTVYNQDGRRTLSIPIPCVFAQPRAIVELVALPGDDLVLRWDYILVDGPYECLEARHLPSGTVRWRRRPGTDASFSGIGVDVATGRLIVQDECSISENSLSLFSVGRDGRRGPASTLAGEYFLGTDEASHYYTLTGSDVRRPGVIHILDRSGRIEHEVPAPTGPYETPDILFAVGAPGYIVAATPYGDAPGNRVFVCPRNGW